MGEVDALGEPSADDAPRERSCSADFWRLPIAELSDDEEEGLSQEARQVIEVRDAEEMVIDADDAGDIAHKRPQSRETEETEAEHQEADTSINYSSGDVG